ncbi:transcription-repair coupling factor [Gemmatimonadota bacterium]
MTDEDTPFHTPEPSGWREQIIRAPFYQQVIDRMAAGGRFELAGLPGSLGPALISLAARDTSSGLLAIFPEQEEAVAAALDFISILGPEYVDLLDPWPFSPYEELSPSATLSLARLEALRHLSRLDQDGGIVVTSAPALTLWSADYHQLQEMDIKLSDGDEYSFDHLVVSLQNMGYERVAMVEGPGEYTVRGGLVDVSIPGRGRGLRIEFWGETIESLREFNFTDQRTTGGLSQTRIPGVREIPLGDDILDRASSGARRLPDEEMVTHTPLGNLIEGSGYTDGLEWFLPLLVRNPSTLADLLPDGVPVAIREPERVDEELRRIRQRAEENHALIEKRDGWLLPGNILTPPDILATIRAARPGIDLTIAASPGVDTLRTTAMPVPIFTGDFGTLRRETRKLNQEGIDVTILVETEEQTRRLEDLLHDDSDRPDHTGTHVRLEIGQLESGFIWPEAGLAVWPDHEIFSRPRRIRPSRSTGGPAIRSFRSLNYGDLVVHVDHGVGQFKGLRTMNVDGRQTELLELGYEAGDRLLVPIDQMARVQRYVGADEDTVPRLNTIGSGAWERTVERTRTDLLEMAKDLAHLYASRETASGKAYPQDDILMEELEASFPFTETVDQARAVEEVKRDLENDKPMDRLVCGDVGYGKTEIAIRAALKVIEGGDQVAILVPTTVLAQQHLETFRSRLGSFPVKIEMLSRFRTRNQQQRTLDGLKSGDVDLVIGTHRLLSGDVEFSSLGLIVLDEEHRFGVKAKEKLRSIRSDASILSLTATPIPRTLHMSLQGIRDISIITTPPEDRLPIQSEVVKFEEKLIREAIERELDRGGQIFFVHNRVQSIESAVNLIERLVPGARTGMAHGQMNERKLEQIMLEFSAGALDILVSTMIIESGLDLPNVNTLLVNRADRFGLAQLYQLRGRVGRSSERAYAYFMVPPGRSLTRDARRRLQAVQDYSELGAGFQLALRDLEIRGAGNLLGAQQHGHITAVGFDLFTEMLEEAIADIQGVHKQAFQPPRLEVPVEAYLPEEYIPLPGIRLAFYRRASEARTFEDIAQLQLEIRDRFGPPPTEVENLLDISMIRVAGTELGLDLLVIKENMVTGRFRKDWTPGRTEWENILVRLGPDTHFSGKVPLRFERQLIGVSPAERTRELRNILLTEDEAQYVTRSVTVNTSGKSSRHDDRY